MGGMTPYLLVTFVAVVLFNWYLRRRAARRGSLVGAPIPPWRSRVAAKAKYYLACSALLLAFGIPIYALATQLEASGK